MHDIEPYAIEVLLVALALLAAVGSNRIAEILRVPAPALFLLAAAVAAQLFPSLSRVSVTIDQRIVTVALVLILFDGGMHIGVSRIRTTVGAVAWLGVAGTLVTAAAVALGAHFLFDFAWRAALLLGTALAPTDPAVVFSVLGRREISGPSGTLLEGESGANDPVGIALMVSLLAATGGGWSAVGTGASEFALQMGVGAVVGVVGGWALLHLMRRVALPSEALYPIQVIAFALLLYGVAAACRGSGFLAVFIAGILVGDARAPYKREVERFAGALSSVGEIVAFVVLGLSVSLDSVFAQGRIWTGLALAALLILVARPVLVGLVLMPVRMTRGERAFVLWAGLKGAVPILLGTYVITENVAGARRMYDVIFVVVLVSVVVQGGLVPFVARLCKVPMRVVEPEPWALGLRFREQPEGLRRFRVAPGSPADGASLRDLDVGEDCWISMISRRGRLVQVRGDTTLQAGDLVLALTEQPERSARVFSG